MRATMFLGAGCCLLGGALAAAAGPCGKPALQLESGLTIVPFAVPVAVPVAVIQSPAVLYRVRDESGAETSSTLTATNNGGKMPPPPCAPAENSAAQAAAILTRHCAVCHAAVAPRGGLTLFQLDGRLLERLPRQAILEAVEPLADQAPRMPPDGRAPLSADELRSVRRWATPPRELSW